MAPLESAKRKILDHAESWHKGSAFALALSPAELHALVKAFPNGFPVKVERKDPA